MLATMACVRDGRLLTAAPAEPPIALGSEQWYAWLERHSVFVYESAAGSFIARKAGGAAGQSFWRAYAPPGAGGARAYLGCSRKLTLARLSLVAHELSRRAGAPLPPPEYAPPPAPAPEAGERARSSQQLDEALAALPGDAQRFLLSTALLQPVCPALCQAVVQTRGGRTASQILGQVAATGSFLAPADGEGGWYRYHEPVAEALLQRLRARAPGRERILRRRAAAWYAGHGMLEEAIGQWLAAHEWRAAAGLIEQVADAYLRASNDGPLEAWLAALPRELIHDRPRLSIALANMLARRGDLAALEALLASVEAHLLRGPGDAGAAPADRPQLEARVMVIRAALARVKGDQLAAHSLGQRALAELPPDDHDWRVQALFDLAVVTYLNDELRQAMGAFSELGVAARRAGQQYTALLAGYHQSAVLRDMGRLSDAEGLRQRIGEQVGPSAADLPLHAFGDLGEALVCIERDALPAAEAALRRGHGRLSGQYHPTLKILLAIAQTRYALAARDLEGAMGAVEAAEQHLAGMLRADSGPTWRQSFVRAWRARVDLARGATDEVQRWARAELERPTGAGAPIAQWSYRSIPLMLARADLLRGRADAARLRLEPLRERAERCQAHDVLIELLVLLACAHHQAGEREAALAGLARAVQLGEPERYTRTFLDEGEPAWALLEQLRARGGAPAAGAARLLARLGAEPRPQAVEALTPREQQVLALVAAGYSNREIAQALYLTVGTVKSHMSAIHGKLGVQRRGQAVAYARELGLLGGAPIPVSRR